MVPRRSRPRCIDLVGRRSSKRHRNGERSARQRLTMDFSDYGATVNVTAPPASEVGTFQSFLQAAASLTASSTSTN
jgi:hypothetical protein